MSVNLEKSREAKEKGNVFFKNKQYEKAAECYSQALDICPKEEEKERSVYFKNRAACNLKLQKYKDAISDCLCALTLNPIDIKTIYRYAQALEGMGKESEALIQLKKLLAIEPRNREANEMARRILASVKQESERLQSTDGLTDEMYSTLADPSMSLERKMQAAKNLAILSREEGGAEKIFRSGGMVKLMPYLENRSVNLVAHILQTFVGLCMGSKSHACSVLQTMSLERVSAFISSTHNNIATAVVALLKEVILSLTREDKQAPKNEESVVVPPSSLIVPIIQMLFLSLASFDVSANTRDCILELFLKTIPVADMANIYLKEGLIEKVLFVATHTWDVLQVEEDDEKQLAVSDKCRMNVSMVLAVLYEQFIIKPEHKEQRQVYKQQSIGFVVSRLHSTDSESRIAGLTALSAILTGVIEVGNEIFADEAVLTVAIQMAESFDPSCQAIAAEALTLAASDKTRCEGIMAKGLPALKQLYHSSENQVKVRALVGLCKLGASSGGNVNSKPFADGATLKLEKMCRHFLVKNKKRQNLSKWGAEGMAFLSLDAEVKEALINDEAALKVLFNLVDTLDKSLLYGIASIFVNLTNSYDKPERNPELEELGKYAGENVPKEHELDGEKFVKQRISSLLKVGVIPPLSTLGSCESKAIREQVARVFLALTSETSHRGAIIQQGGVKCLLPLALDNTDVGKLKASQALAKICITNNPQLAFPGQRCLEVVRPLVCLLKSENGLQQFEGLMALTNLAAMSDDVRLRILREGAIPLMEGLMFEEHDMIRCAATEALCNLIQLQEVHERFYGDDIERVKLWTLFSGEEDQSLARAASGGLAQLSHDPKICKKILEVKSSTEILKELVGCGNPELQYRGMYILANLVEASRDIASKIIEDEFLEVFLACVQGAFPTNVRNEAERALKKATEYGLIMPNPELTT